MWTGGTLAGMKVITLLTDARLYCQVQDLCSGQLRPLCRTCDTNFVGCTRTRCLAQCPLQTDPHPRDVTQLASPSTFVLKHNGDCGAQCGAVMTAA